LVAIFGKLADLILSLAGFATFPGAKGRKLGYRYHPGVQNTGSGLACSLARRYLGVVSGDKDPIILLHGLGGYAPHTPLILALIPLGRPIFVVEQPHVSFKLGLFCQTIPTISEMVSSVHLMLEKHEHHPSQALVIAHSLGAGLAAALNENQASGRFRTLLIDPISIRLFDPQLARAFSACRPASAFAEMIRYFTLERGAATYVARHFDAFSSALCLHPAEGIEKSTVSTKVIISRNDFLIPVGAIVKQCKELDVQCYVLENTDHGGWLFSIPLFGDVVDVIRGIAAPPVQGKRETGTINQTSTNVLGMIQRRRANSVITPAAAPCSQISREPSSNGTLAARDLIGRTRSRTLCGVAMKPCRSVRISEGISSEMRKMGSATGLVY
jgi:pimeloyl-ACP methyl ester carboxylesterase